MRNTAKRREALANLQCLAIDSPDLWLPGQSKTQAIIRRWCTESGRNPADYATPIVPAGKL